MPYKKQDLPKHYSHICHYERQGADSRPSYCLSHLRGVRLDSAGIVPILSNVNNYLI